MKQKSFNFIFQLPRTFSSQTAHLLNQRVYLAETRLQREWFLLVITKNLFREAGMAPVFKPFHFNIKILLLTITAFANGKASLCYKT